ncbi:predicted protein [Nematostella vectensis]|uniref:Uncharacterized protein n=1 Tax=Nematostella vectensis TaxID=45351 RepID=A7SBL7_NEMVE|nr:predicted protein [Nematostella vectensis]|eukprot:XP_001630955.1 predicted protein [Nematostella vectensis]
MGVFTCLWRRYPWVRGRRIKYFVLMILFCSVILVLLREGEYPSRSSFTDGKRNTQASHNALSYMSTGRARRKSPPAKVNYELHERGTSGKIDSKALRKQFFGYFGVVYTRSQDKDTSVKKFKKSNAIINAPNRKTKWKDSDKEKLKRNDYQGQRSRQSVEMEVTEVSKRPQKSSHDNRQYSAIGQGITKPPIKHSNTEHQTTSRTLPISDRNKLKFDNKHQRTEMSLPFKKHNTFRQNVDIKGIPSRLPQGEHSDRKKAQEVQHKDPCPHFLVTREPLYGDCIPHVPSQGACDQAKEMFKLNRELLRCNQTRSEICTLLMGEYPMGSTKFRVKCHRGVCKERTVPKSIKVQVLEPGTGMMHSGGTFESIDDLEQELLQIINANIANKLYFIVISCRKNFLKNDTITQLLTFDPKLTLRRDTSKLRDKGLVNVNILLLDSVSRAHFYRSLPKTIELFRSWESRSDRAPARVFDFELFQSVEGHTAENTHALFTGKMFSAAERKVRTPVGAGEMFGAFRGAGYQTMWQEDLCWTAIWGLMIDMVANNFKDLPVKLENNFIDHTGLTHSSCPILGAYGTNNPFQGPEGDQICYNGDFHHTYLLNYTSDLVKAIARDLHARPLLAYMSSSVGHDHRALRTQTLDPALARYVTEMANSDTITVILADHGNTYSEYTISSLEGKFEMFHPVLFIIIPNNVARLLGEDAMKALATNQQRLVTMIDLHHTLMTLVDPLRGRVTSRGLFAPIPANKTCNDVELIAPNLCVCEGWDSPTTNDTFKVAMVEFALGELNNMLVSQQAKLINPRGLVTSCQRLGALRFENVRERHDAVDGSLITTMDIYVPAGDVVPQKEDLFHVEINSFEKPGDSSMGLRLLQFDRLSMFGGYGACADRGVDLKLCVCSARSNHTSSRISVNYSPNVIGKEAVVLLSVDPENCVLLWQRNHSLEVYGFEVTNSCWETDFVISIDAKHDNMAFSRSLPFTVTVPSGRRVFMMSARKYYPYWSSKLDIVVQLMRKKREE